MTSPFISSSHRKITVMCLISSLLEFFCLCILKRDGVSLMAQMVRTPPEMQEPWVQYIYWHTYIFLDSIYLHVLKEFTVSGFQWGNPAIFFPCCPCLVTNVICTSSGIYRGLPSFSVLQKNLCKIKTSWKLSRKNFQNHELLCYICYGILNVFLEVIKLLCFPFLFIFLIW